MVKLLFILISFITFCDLSQSSNIECDYSNITFGKLKGVYTCEVKRNVNIISKDTAVIESYNGHSTNVNVFAFVADNKKIEYFPKGLEKFFPNIKGIYIKNGRLKEIQQSDFKGYSDLVYIELNSNDIEYLEDGVFDFMPSIESIFLIDNKITHVGENALNSLTSLQVFSFVRNTCASFRYNSYQMETIRTSKTLKEKCFDQKFAKFSTDLKNLEEKAKDMKREDFYIFTLTLEKLEKDFKVSKFTYLSSIKERFHVLKFITPDRVASENTCLTSKFENLEGNLKAAVIRTLNQKLEDFQGKACAIIDERTPNNSLDLDNSFSELMNKLKDTDRKINEISIKWSKFANFPTEVSKRMGKYESDQMQLVKSEAHTLKQAYEAENMKFRSLEDRIAKIEENVEKILEALGNRS